MEFTAIGKANRYHINAQGYWDRRAENDRKVVALLNAKALAAQQRQEVRDHKLAMQKIRKAEDNIFQRGLKRFLRLFGKGERA